MLAKDFNICLTESLKKGEVMVPIDRILAMARIGAIRGKDNDEVKKVC